MSEISVSKSVPPFACCLPIDKQINKQTDKTQNVDVKVVMSTSHMQSVCVAPSSDILNYSQLRPSVVPDTLGENNLLSL